MEQSGDNTELSDDQPNFYNDVLGKALSEEQLFSERSNHFWVTDLDYRLQLARNFMDRYGGVKILSESLDFLDTRIALIEVEDASGGKATSILEETDDPSKV